MTAWKVRYWKIFEVGFDGGFKIGLFFRLFIVLLLTAFPVTPFTFGPKHFIIFIILCWVDEKIVQLKLHVLRFCVPGLLAELLVEGVVFGYVGRARGRAALTLEQAVGVSAERAVQQVVLLALLGEGAHAHVREEGDEHLARVLVGDLVLVGDHGLGDAELGGRGHAHVLRHAPHQLRDLRLGGLRLLKQVSPRVVVEESWVDGAPGGQGLADGVGAEGDDVEEDVVLPVGRLPAQQLHVGPQHGVEEGVGAAERDLHDGGRRDVGVAVLLQPRHQTRQRRTDVRRTRRANNLGYSFWQFGGNMRGLRVPGVGKNDLKHKHSG